jgi:hypothetical protein
VSDTKLNISPVHVQSSLYLEPNLAPVVTETADARCSLLPVRRARRRQSETEIVPTNFVDHDILVHALTDFLDDLVAHQEDGLTAVGIHRRMMEQGVYKAIDGIPKRAHHNKVRLRSCRGVQPQRVLKYYLRKCGIIHNIARRRVYIQGKRTWVYKCQFSRPPVPFANPCPQLEAA